MRTLRRAEEARRACRQAMLRSESIGLVPTMGSLHAGHMSLVRRCRRECGLAVVSIFVNPAQFGPGEDLEAYPRDLQRDARLLEAEGVDLLFAPGVEELYQPGHSTWVEVEGLTSGMCGAHRPGHFRGVCTVVAKLFGIVRPDTAYFGQKDWQQAVVLRKMARELDAGVRVKICPTVREPDGLALSSRNAYLDARQRREAPRLHRALQEARRRALEGSLAAPRQVTAAVRDALADGPLRLQYAELREAESLEPAGALEGSLVLAAAAHLGGTRLIDNVLIDFDTRE